MNLNTPAYYTGQLIVSGSGAKELLQGQLTCDVNQLSATHTILGAHCHRTGKIVSLFFLSSSGTDFILSMPRELVPQAKAALQKYALLYRDVRLTDNSEAITDTLPAITRLRSGLPALYPETSEQFFAHELNLTELNAISFDKGCYTGQEIIARMHYRGKPKTGLQSVTVHSPQLPKRGHDIFAATGPCGRIVDFAESDPNHYLMLVTAPLSSTEQWFMDETHTLPLQRG